jgi:hypothetical protein
MGLMSIPFVYLLGRYLARSSNAGLVAALCLALSPQNIWYAQEIRPSPLVSPLVILSLYALFRALRGRGAKWWLINMAANALLLETQLFTVFMLPVEALLACFYLRRRFKTVMAWGFAHILFLVPWTIFILRMPASYTDEFRDRFVSVARLVSDMFLDDVVNLQDHLLPAWKTGNPVQGLTGAALPWRPWADGLLMAVIILVLAWYAIMMARTAIRWWGGRSAGDRITLENGLVMCALMVVPVAILGFASWATGRPYQQANYAYYNTVGLYVVLGAALTRLPRRAFRAAAVGLVAVLYAVQLALFLPGTTREDWRSASKHIMDHGTPGDLVLEYTYLWPDELLAFYFQNTPFSAKRVSSLQGAFEQMDRFFSQPGSGSRHAWLLFEGCNIDWIFPDFNFKKTTDDALEARNLTGRLRVFAGHYGIVCLEVECKPGLQAVTSSVPVPPLEAIDFESLRSELGIPAQTEAERREALDGLRRRLSFRPPPGKFFLIVHVLDSLTEGDIPVAEALARRAVSDYPRFSLAHYTLGMALFRSHKQEESRREFERAFALDGGVKFLLGPLADALFNKSDPSAVRRECAKLRELHFFCAEAFESMAGK